MIIYKNQCATKNTVNNIIYGEKIFIALNEKCIEFLLAGVADESYYNQILKYFSLSKYFAKDKNYIYYNTVSYVYPNNGIGRLKPYILKKVKDNSGNKVNISVTGRTQTYMWNELKSFILKDLYYDVDIVNCQSSILEHIVIKSNITSKYVNIYNNDRESYIKQMMDTFKMSRSEAKTFIIKIMFGGIIKRDIYDKLPEDRYKTL